MVDVSFIIPAYNAEKYIKKCVDCLLEIKKIEIEVIVINDGSTDNTLKCLEDINDLRLDIISQENQGVSAARNMGLSHAKGIYVFFVDADDYVLTEKFENYISNISLNIDIYMFSYKTVLRDGKKIKAALPLPDGIYEEDDIKKLSLRLYDIKFSKNYNSKYFGGKVYQYLFRRNFLICNNICFLNNVHFAEDCIFCFQCFQHAHSIQIDDICLYEYYIYNESASHMYRPNLWKELVASYELADRFSKVRIKNRNEIFFFYGNEVIRRIVINIDLSKYKIAIEKIRELLDEEEFQEAINNLSFSKWTIRERILQILYRSKSAKLTYLFYIVIVELGKLKIGI